MNNPEKQHTIKLINNNIKEILHDIVLCLELPKQSREHLQKQLSFLQNIQYIYPLKYDVLYAETLSKLSQCSIYRFDAEIIISKLIHKFFNQLHIFQEAYEISVLRLNQAKYKNLHIQEPVIKVTIQKPYICQPLKQAKYLGEAKCIYLQEQLSEMSVQKM